MWRGQQVALPSTCVGTVTDLDVLKESRQAPPDTSPLTLFLKLWVFAVLPGLQTPGPICTASPGLLGTQRPCPRVTLLLPAV